MSLFVNLKNKEFLKSELLSKQKIYFFTLSILISLLATAINQSWLFDPFSFLDHWVYFGASYYFPEVIQRFAGSPVTELIPVFLPGAFFYKLFPIGVADFLKDILLLSLTLFSIGSIVHGICGRFYAISTMILMVGYPSFIHHIGESYTTGYVITYLSLTLYFIYQAILKKDDSNSRKIYLIISGFIFGLSVMSAILSSIYILPILLFLVLNKSFRKRFNFNSFKEDLKWIFFGGFISLIIIYVISINLYGINTSFPLQNNINKLLRFASSDVFKVPITSEFISNANWLLMPTFVSVFAIIQVVINLVNSKLKKVVSPYRELLSESYNLQDGKTLNYKNSTIVNSLLIIGPTSFFIIIFLNLYLNQWTLQYSYFSQSLPFIFLSLAGCLYSAFGKNKGNLSIIPTIILTIISLLSTRFSFIHTPIHYLNQRMETPDLYLNEKINSPHSLYFWLILFFLPLLFALCILPIINNRLLIKRIYPYILILFLSISFPLSITKNFSCFMCSQKILSSEFGYDYARSPNHLRNSTVKLTDKLLEIDPNRNARFWYTIDDDSNAGLILQANGIHNLFSYVNQNYPNLIQKERGAYRGKLDSLENNETILVLSSDDSGAEKGIISLEKNNFSHKVLKKEVVDFGNNTKIYITHILVNI